MSVPVPSGAKPRSVAATLLLLGASLLPGPAPAQAQETGPLGALQGGVPTGEATKDEIALSLTAAIERGLRYNLGSILSEAAVTSAEGARKEALADLLPQVRAGVLESRQKINLAAFGFTSALLPGVPQIVGPFNLFDARAYLQQTVLDLKALHKSHASADSLDAARQDEHSARDLVVLVCGQLYLQAVAGEARIAASRAQLGTSEALLAVARDRKASGLGAGIEVLRAEVQERSQRQRLIVAEQDAAKEKLALARAIGLPLGQRYRLADPMPVAPGVPMSVDAAVERAWADRPDLKAAQARAQAAEDLRKSAQGEGLPSLAVSGDYGAIGNDVPGALATFTVAAGLRVPLFEGGRVRARVREAEARAQQERARLADLKARIYYEVQAVFLDIQAADDRVAVAEGARALAREQLQQAKDRFAAGVADNVEVVQAQESLAAADENHIASLYAQNVARLSLARTLGGVETSYADLLKGR
ncbi:MAG TPA: TolC family protein [Vicinamibacteria bacterium]|nr:TolC family protein [Vicinamibacteria bacterium]